MPKISVIIPVYNVEKYLRRCLDSVKNQTFDDWEAICVNDGSPDNSAAILAEYAAADKRFKIVTKENGGLSDARNVGMEHVRGEYVIYLDSDDSIHPQTMEISYALARRDGSDIVSWYKDKMYRPRLLVLNKLGFNIDGATSRGIKKRYKLADVKTFVTDDVFAHSTEQPYPETKWSIKHFYVWRHLFRRELIWDIKFIKGLTFEDFPWWSEVMLKHPRVTITKLPFSYYFPNVNSIDMKSAQIKKAKNWIRGLDATYALYRARAEARDMARWRNKIMWPVIIWQIFRKVKYIETDADRKFMQEAFARFNADGMFDNPPTDLARAYKKKILRFIRKG